MKTGLLHGKSPDHTILSVEQIALHQLLEQLVPVQLADHASGTVVIGDVGGVLGEKVAHNLVGGVIALLAQSVVNGAQDLTRGQLFTAGDRKLDGVVTRHLIDLLCILTLL